MKIVYEDHVSYDVDLPEFGTNGGVHIHNDKVTITAPTAMFVKALDVVLERMEAANFDFGNVVAIGGATQQSTSAYVKPGARETLKKLDVDMSLYDQLKDIFSIPEPPMWMDTTARKQCRQLEDAIGGSMKLALLTGSRALDVNPAPVIMKIYQSQREAYENTEKIFLMSNLMASLFLGKFAPMDYAVASITNLLDIGSKTWSSKCLDACAAGLAEKLGELVPSHTILMLTKWKVEHIRTLTFLRKCYLFDGGCSMGKQVRLCGLMHSAEHDKRVWHIRAAKKPGFKMLALFAYGNSNFIVYLKGNVSTYMQTKYKFSKECKLLAWTGDNAQSIVGMALQDKELTITLGTADCFYICSSTPIINLYGHAMISTLDPNAFIHELGWRNGSLTRQHVMERCAGSWEKFAELLNMTPPGNNGNIGIYFECTEIMPRVIGTYRLNNNNELVKTFAPEVEVRAVLEGQFIARRMYAERCGFSLGHKKRILATGGGSANKTILQVLSDIFNTPVYTIDVRNSAALGGCYRAKLAIENAYHPRVLKGVPQPVCAATPTPGLEKVYEDMLRRYQKLEEEIASKFEVQ